MIKIGDFSKICMVSVKALRHWDSIDLLKPALTDAQTGYRYYSIEQVERVNRILAFRAMGLGLPQIKQLLHENMSTSDIRAMLRLKQLELQQQLEDTAATLMFIESRLKQIDYEGQMPNYEVSLKSADPQSIVAIRERTPTMDSLVGLLRETYPYARQRDNTNLLAVFHDDGYDAVEIDVEIGFPVEGDYKGSIPLDDERTMTVTHLPQVELMAATVHHGPWVALSQGYLHVGRWIEMNDYEIVAPGREIYHYIDWENDQTATVTELQFPITKRSK